MKLFRKRRPENGEEEDELDLDPNASDKVAGQEMAGAATSPPAQAASIADDPLAQMRADAAAETAAAETRSEGAASSPQPDDPLDAGLMDLFREAQNEVQESTLASDLPDVPIEDLLNDLVSVSQRLGIRPGTGALRRDNARGHDSEPRASRK